MQLEGVGKHVRASVITPACPGRWKKGQNDGNPCAYSEKPTSHRKFLGFRMFYMDFLYFLIFCYIFIGCPINGHPHMFSVLDLEAHSDAGPCRCRPRRSDWETNNSSQDGPLLASG